MQVVKIFIFSVRSCLLVYIYFFFNPKIKNIYIYIVFGLVSEITLKKECSQKTVVFKSKKGGLFRSFKCLSLNIKNDVYCSFNFFK